MNKTVQDIINRRSVKLFKSDQIADEELMAVLEAGLNAPSGGNRQTQRFIVIQDKAWREKIASMNVKIGNRVSPEGYDPFYGAPTVILVVAEECANATADGSLAMGNMLNAAYALGLGARWINRIKETFETDLGKEILAEVGFEGEYKGVGACIIGYPADGFPETIPRKPGRYSIIK